MTSELIHNLEAHGYFKMNTAHRFIRGIWDQEYKLEIDATEESGIVPSSRAGRLERSFCLFFEQILASSFSVLSSGQEGRLGAKMDTGFRGCP